VSARWEKPIKVVDRWLGSDLPFEAVVARCRRPNLGVAGVDQGGAAHPAPEKACRWCRPLAQAKFDVEAAAVPVEGADRTGWYRGDRLAWI